MNRKEEDRSLASTHDASRVTSFSLYVAAIALAFWGVFQLDVPLARWIQGIDEPWFERLGEIGQWLGDWRALLGVSGLILALSALNKNASLREAGVATLIAHAYAALAVQSLKHLVGRARPRLSHESSLFIGPNFNSGFDSLPSGHTTASVAIAIVVARRFPRYAWLAYGVAGVIAASRVIKGSHFPGDVLAGICLGSLAGHVAQVPFSRWREGLAQGIRAGWPWVVGIATLFIIIAQPAVREESALALSISGGLLVLIGAILRWNPAGSMSGISRWAVPAVGVGLACTTGSWLVTGVALILVGGMTLDQEDGVWPRLSERQAAPIELAWLLSLGLLVVAIQATRSLHPIP